MERRRGGEELVRPGEVASVVPGAPGRLARRNPSLEKLRGPRLLIEAAEIKAKLAQVAREHGFDAIGITRPDAAPLAEARLRQFLAEGAHGDMAWMETTAARRGDPQQLWPEVRSIIMLGLNYAPGDDPLAALARRDRGVISVYAQGDDYHEVIKPRLKSIARWLLSAGGGDVKVFVDTAAVMEKPLAAAAALGWQGKHTNLVSREFGSWLFLGAIFTTLDLPADEVAADSCGSCRACLDVCPTAAFPAPYRLDARRCISYLTIEHKGPIPRDLRPLIGNRIYGCDDCLAVCPWNKFAQQGREQKLAAREALRAPTLAQLARLDDPSFRTLFAKSPVKRIGRDRFIRNVLIAIGNSGDRNLAAEAEGLLGDPSPLVRGAAVWALGRVDPNKLAAMARERAREDDSGVEQEWTITAEELALNSKLRHRGEQTIDILRA
jgi:epoxyqueuosine reductase